MASFPVFRQRPEHGGTQDFTYGDALLTAALGPGSYGANNPK